MAGIRLKPSIQARPGGAKKLTVDLALPVQNGSTLGQSVDKLNLRVSVSGSQMKNINRPGDSVFVTFLLLMRHGHMFIGRFRHHAG